MRKWHIPLDSSTACLGESENDFIELSLFVEQEASSGILFSNKTIKMVSN